MSDSRFDVKTDQRARGVVACLSGEATNEHADDLRQAFVPILKARALCVVLDLSDLAFIASLALAELIDLRRNLQTYGGQLRLAGARPDIERLFRTTRLSELFPMYPTADAAL